MTTSSGRAPARARLAKLMDSRRRELRLTWDEVAARAGINRETLRQIRIGDGNIRPLTATGIEDALEWKHGSIDAITDDGDPTPAEDVQVVEQGDDEPDPILKALAARLERLEKAAARHEEENAELRRQFRAITRKNDRPGEQSRRNAI